MAWWVGLGALLSVCLSLLAARPRRSPSLPHLVPHDEQPTKHAGKGKDGPTNIGLTAHRAHHHEPVFRSRIALRLQEERRRPRREWSNNYLSCLPFLSGRAAGNSMPPPGRMECMEWRGGREARGGPGAGAPFVRLCPQPARWESQEGHSRPAPRRRPRLTRRRIATVPGR